MHSKKFRLWDHELKVIVFRNNELIEIAPSELDSQKLLTMGVAHRSYRSALQAYFGPGF